MVTRSSFCVLLVLLGCAGGPASPAEQASSIVTLHAPSLARGSLSVAGVGLGPDAFARVLADPAVTTLTDLRLSDNALDTASVAALLASPKTSSLTTLDLAGNPIGDEGLRLIAASPRFPALDTLRLERIGAGPTGAAALGGVTGTITIRQLDLGGNPLRDAGALALVGLPVAASFTLEDAQIGPAGARAMVAGVQCPRLSLAGNPVGSGGLHGLTQLSPLLTELSLDHALLGPMDALTLAELPAPGLRRLSLRGNALGSEGVRALVKASWFATLDTLDVRDVGADGATSAAITAAWGGRPGLSIGG